MTMVTTALPVRDLVLSDGDYRDEDVTLTPSGVAGSITDTTTYPVVAQTGLTEKFTVDDGTEQTITFTNAIAQGSVIDTTSYPCADQTGLTEKVTIDGGAEQTVTFTTCTTAAHVIAQMDAHLTGCRVVAEGTHVRIYSDSKSTSSSVAIGTGTCALAWASPAAVNTAESIALQINDQIDGASAGVVGGQVKVTSDLASAESEVSNGTGTAALTWATDVDGTGVSSTMLKGSLLGRSSVTGKLVPYASAGSDGAGTPVAVLPSEETWTTSGDKRLKILFGGKVDQTLLVAHDVAGAVPIAAVQSLMTNSNIVAIQTVATGA
jgi:hypothetical protein